MKINILILTILMVFGSVFVHCPIEADAEVEAETTETNTTDGGSNTETVSFILRNQTTANIIDALYLAENTDSSWELILFPES